MTRREREYTMDSKKLVWFLIRLNLIVWLAAAGTAVWLNGAEAAPVRETLCHFGATMQVPSGAVAGHLAHGDYLGVCVAPTPEPTPEPTPTPTPVPAPIPEMPKIVIENMWLLVGRHWMYRDDGSIFGFRDYCILISDTHPSVEVQKAKCFPNGGWRAWYAPCAGPIYANDVWACDDELQERGWSRLSLANLCQRYPRWCNQP